LVNEPGHRFGITGINLIFNPWIEFFDQSVAYDAAALGNGVYNYSAVWQLSGYTMALYMAVSAVYRMICAKQPVWMAPARSKFIAISFFPCFNR